MIAPGALGRLGGPEGPGHCWLQGVTATAAVGGSPLHLGTPGAGRAVG